MQIDPSAVEWDDGPPLSAVKWDGPVGSDTPESLNDAFWQASRAGDKKTATDTFRKMQAQGVKLGAPRSTERPLGQTQADEDSVATNSVAGWGMGSRKVVRGIVQAANKFNPAYYMNDKGREYVDNFMPDNPREDRALSHTSGGMVTNIGAQAAPFAVAPEIRTTQQAMGLAGLQGFAAPLPTGANTWENRLLMGGVAVPLGGLGYLATRGAANSAAGAAAGYGDEAQLTVDAARRLADRTGVKAPLNAGDLGSPNVRQLQDVVFENTPFSGRVREMSRQQKAVTAGVDDLKARFPETADQPEVIMQRSMLEAQKQAKSEAKRLYDIVDLESQAPGVGPLSPTQASAALKRGLEQYPEMLDSIGNSATRGKIELLLSGSPVSFADTREMMSAIRSQLSAAQKRQAMGTPGAGDSVLQLGRLQGALEADQVAWAQGVGGKAHQAMKEANAHFGKKVAPYRNQPELRNVVKRDANPEGLLRTSADGFETAARRMDAMTPEGQDAYRRGLVQKAVEAGTRDDGKLNLLTLVNNLPNGRAAEKIFSPADLQVINDLARYAKAVDRSLNVGNTPLTGKQVAKMTPSLAAGSAAGAAGGFPAVAGGVVLANLARRVASSRVLRAMLHGQKVESQLGQIVAQRAALPTTVAAGNTGLAGLVAPRVQERR